MTCREAEWQMIWIAFLEPDTFALDLGLTSALKAKLPIWVILRLDYTNSIPGKSTQWLLELEKLMEVLNGVKKKFTYKAQNLCFIDQSWNCTLTCSPFSPPGPSLQAKSFSYSFEELSQQRKVFLSHVQGVLQLWHKYLTGVLDGSSQMIILQTCLLRVVLIHMCQSTQNRSHMSFLYP